MRTKITILLTALISMACYSVNILAQDHTRNWDNGNVVAVTEIHIKDGMFNAYINDLNNVWRIADVARSANIKRGDLRTLGSNYNLQEVKFRK